MSLYNKPPAETLDNNYRYHTPVEGQQALYEEVRAKAKEFAKLIDSLGSNREFSIAHTNLETAVMFVNAGIARNQIAQKEGVVEAKGTQGLGYWSKEVLNNELKKIVFTADDARKQHDAI